MDVIPEEVIVQSLEYGELIPALATGFKSEIRVPMRHHHDYRNPNEESDSTLLLMPAWQESEFLGVKTVTVSPNNSRYDLPSIHGLYLLFDARNGQPRAILDAKSLTRIRTAATSALASSFLSREDSKVMLMVGTGALAPELIKAHAEVRNLEKFYIWGRNREKAELVAQQFAGQLDVTAIDNLDDFIRRADIISVATLSNDPLIKGSLLKKGTHLDLVGAYRKDMREADDEVMLRSKVFVDSVETAPKETGDLYIPLQQGVISLKDIKADLFDLCSHRSKGRTSASDITCFKSVGHALEDLVAAIMVYQKTSG